MRHTYPQWFHSDCYKGLNTHVHVHDTADLVQKGTKTEVANLKKIRTKIDFLSQEFPWSSCWYSRWQEIKGTKVGCPVSYMVFENLSQTVHLLFALYQNRKCECRWSTYVFCVLIMYIWNLPTEE